MDLNYICISLGWAVRQGNAISTGPNSNLSLFPSEFKWQLRFCWTVICITLPNAVEFKQLPIFFSTTPFWQRSTLTVYSLGAYNWLICVQVMYCAQCDLGCGLCVLGHKTLGVCIMPQLCYMNALYLGFYFCVVLLGLWGNCSNHKLKNISVVYFHWSSCKALFITALWAL